MANCCSVVVQINSLVNFFYQQKANLEKIQIRGHTHWIQMARPGLTSSWNAVRVGSILIAPRGRRVYWRSVCIQETYPRALNFPQPTPTSRPRWEPKQILCVIRVCSLLHSTDVAFNWLIRQKGYNKSGFFNIFEKTQQPKKINNFSGQNSTNR